MVCVVCERAGQRGPLGCRRHRAGRVRVHVCVCVSLYLCVCVRLCLHNRADKECDVEWTQESNSDILTSSTTKLSSLLSASLP